MAAAASGGVQPLQVSIQITTTGARQAANAMSNVTKSSQKMSTGLGAGVISARTLGDAMRMSATLMKYTVAGAFMQVGKAAIQAYRNFELSFSRIRGLVGISSDAINKMKDDVLEMATETTRGPEELAEALYFITSAGIRDASTAMSILKASGKAAASGLGDVKTVADAVTSSMNAYGVANLTASHATDVITAAVREGKAEADTMAPAFSKVLPVAAAYGASFEDVAAAMAALSRSGMTAGTAAIYVRQTLSQLMKPSKQASDLLRSVGTSAEQIQTNVSEKGLFAALQELSGQLGGIEKTANFAKVFGNVRALTAVLQLVGPAAEENAQIFERLQNSAGDSTDAFNAYKDTLDATFNEAAAASRVALIELGEALKPVATLMLDASRAVTTFAKLILDIPGAKPILAIAAALPLIVMGLSAAMKTMSAFIRLSSNLYISLTGTQLMYDATTKSLYKMTAAQIQQNQATQAANLTMKGYTQVTNKAAKASMFFAAAGGKITAILTVVSLVATAIAYFSSNNKEAGESTDSLSKSVGALNELLDETVKYGKSNLYFNVTAQVEKTRLDAEIERARQQIEEQSPDFFKNTKDAFDTSGKDAGLAYLNALLIQLSGMSPQVQNVLANLFAREIGVDVEEITEAIVPAVTGDKVADALIYAAVVGAQSANDGIADLMTSTSLQGLGDAIMNNIMPIEAIEQAGGATTELITNEYMNTLDAMKEFGTGFTDIIQETSGDMAPLLVALNALDQQMVITDGTLAAMLGTTLKGLSGGFNLVSDSAGNMAEIFGKVENQTALIDLIMGTAKITDRSKATAVYEEIKNRVAEIPEGANQATDSFRIFSEVMGEAGVKTETLNDEQQKQIDNLSNLSVMLKETVKDYEDQVGVMKELERAQRGLLGIELTQEEALRDLMDQYQKTGDTIRESSGSFSMETESGRAARAELQQNAESVLQLANAYAAAGDEAGAAEVFAQGMANIVSVAAQAGGEGAGIAAADVLAEMGFTSELLEESMLAAQTTVESSAVATGENVSRGIAAGIAKGQATMSDALIAALKNVVITGQETLKIKSPSKVMASEVGAPMAQGVEGGFTAYASSAKFNRSITKSLDKAVEKAYKSGGRKSVSKFFSDLLEKKKDVETPAQDFVKATISRMKDIIGSLGNYINSQLNFRKAQADLAKLINMQRGLDDRRRRAAREARYAQTRYGMGGGAEVTGYEQSRIDELQLNFERVSRDYAMGRATYTELVDAEIDLNEARESAAEINDEVIGAENAFIDAVVDVENASLELAAATVGVLEAYQDVQEAAAELYMNHKELETVYNNLAEATGIASGKLVIGKTDITKFGDEINKMGGFTSTVGGYVSTLGNNTNITGQAFKNNFDGPTGIFETIKKTGSTVAALTGSIDTEFTDLSKGLIDPEGEFAKALKSLGPTMWRAIQIGAQESLDASPLNLKVSVNAVVDKNGSGSVSWSVTPPTPSAPTTGVVSSPYGPLPGYVNPNTGGYVGLNPYSASSNKKKKAVGGPVMGGTPYMVGERGPEMFLPKVSGTIVTTNALERYVRTRTAQNSGTQTGQDRPINVVVNNPVPQSAEESITRRMKVLANSGLFG